MKICLINTNQFKNPWPIIPFGLTCVASYLKSKHHEVRFLDLCFSRDPARDIKKTLATFQPEVVGVSIRNLDSCVGYQTQFFLDGVRRDMMAPLKKHFTGPIVLGGPAVGINAEEMLAYFDLTYAIRGDGEEAINEFIRRWGHRESLDDLPGLIIRKPDGRVVSNPPQPICDIDYLPLPNPVDFFDVKPYRQFGSPLQIQTKRGCPLKCSYCTYNQIEGYAYRLRQPERIANEIEVLVRSTGIRAVEFVDSTFNLPLPHAKATMRALIKKNLNLDLSTMGLNPAGMDEELVDLLKEAGFKEVHLGLESAHDITLRDLGKNFNRRKAIESIRLLRKKKIPFIVFLLLGTRRETWATLRETLLSVLKEASRWNLLNISVGVRVYKGSPLANQLKKRYPSFSRDEFFHPVSIKPKHLALADIQSNLKVLAQHHPNIFLYGQDYGAYPEWMIKLMYAVLRLFRLKIPIWRVHIAIQSLVSLFLWKKSISRTPLAPVPLPSRPKIRLPKPSPARPRSSSFPIGPAK